MRAVLTWRVGGESVSMELEGREVSMLLAAASIELGRAEGREPDYDLLESFLLSIPDRGPDRDALAARLDQTARDIARRNLVAMGMDLPKESP